jgi:acetyltransferase-like isoleucine patch superfamily enzyme
MSNFTWPEESCHSESPSDSQRADTGPAHLLHDADNTPDNNDSRNRVLRQRAIWASFLAMGLVRARLSGVDSFGKRPVLRGRVRFELAGETYIGDNFQADGLGSGIKLKVARGARLSIGSGVYMNAGASIEAWHDISIGSNVLMAPFASVIDDNCHEVELGAILYKGPTIVEDNVWLGRNAAVMPGVRIGQGSVIGANSVVTKDIPAKSLATGSPARVIRELNAPDGWVRHSVYGI